MFSYLHNRPQVFSFSSRGHFRPLFSSFHIFLAVLSLWRMTQLFPPGSPFLRLCLPRPAGCGTIVSDTAPPAVHSLRLQTSTAFVLIFDIYDKETNINYSPNEFIYKMIEILLPKANILEAPKGTLKMLEIYAMKNSNRRGWIHLSEEY